ncbi:hypothetical protein ACH4FX_11285 [Streptomyces sp. NPDC018019]|uniref:hypothetical protein n=1 Tax=Streptomyces sp. NPDC018019 TaxID=3365030 RepID=UPI00379735FF
MITPTKPSTWIDLVPCAARDGYVPDASQVDSPSELIAASTPLMQDCADSCLFISRCYERVRPEAGRFDGVCAARLWINGRVIAKAEGAPALGKLPSRAGSCGTSGGVAGHERVGEPLCGQCREVALRAQVRSAGPASIRKRSRGKSSATAAA